MAGALPSAAGLPQPAAAPRQPVRAENKFIYAAPAFALAAAGIFHVSWQTKYYVDE